MKIRVLLVALACLLVLPNETTARTQAERLIKQLDSRKVSDRSSAAWDLGQIGATEAIPALIDALGDDARSVRANAAASLWEMADDAASARPALQAALQDPHAGVVRNAAGALRAMGVTREALAPAYRRLLSDSVCKYQVSGIRGLTGQATPEELFPHALACSRDADFDVSRDAAELLRKMIQDSAMAPLVTTALKQSGDGDVGILIRALAGYQPTVTEAVPAIERYLTSSEVHNRSAAARALGRMKALSTVPSLVRVLRSDAEPQVRKDAAEALGDMGPDAALAVSSLARAATDDSWTEVRKAALSALGEMREAARDVMDVLYAALEDSDPSIRVSARNALFRVDPDNREKVAELADSRTSAAAQGGASNALFESTTGLAEALAGTPEVVELLVYRDFAMVTAPESSSPSGWAKHTYRQGALSGPQEDNPSCEKTFALADVDLDLVPKLAAESLHKAGGGSVVVVQLSRGVFCKKPGWMVVLQDGPKASRVEFEANGKLKKVWQ